MIRDVVIFPLGSLDGLAGCAWRTGFGLIKALTLAIGLTLCLAGIPLSRLLVTDLAKRPLDVVDHPSLSGAAATALAITEPFHWSRNPNWRGANIGSPGGPGAAHALRVGGSAGPAALILAAWTTQPQEC